MVLVTNTLPTNGARLYVSLGEGEVLSYIQNLKYGIAGVTCSNSSASSTISGDEDAIVE